MSYSATAPRQAFAAPAEVVQVPIAAAAAINQGDIVIITSNLGVVTSAITDVPHGIADQTNPVSSIGGDDPLLLLRVIRKGIVFLKLHSGDSVNYDTLVYLCADDAQTVSTSSANSAVKVGKCRETAALTGDGSKLIKVEVNFDAIAL